MNWFDIYYSYLEGCQEFNQQQQPESGWEWHHILPRCLFGDQEPGIWLTKQQHAVASAYQTLAFQTCCVCGWHFKDLTNSLRDLVKPLYKVGYTNRTPEEMQEHGRLGASLQSVEHKSKAGKKGVKAAQRYWAQQTPKARSLNGARAGSGNKGVGGDCRVPGGTKAMSLRYEDPDHPELGHHSAATLARMQRARNYPSTPSNRRKVS
jgi:hypothetical protein